MLEKPRIIEVWST